MWIRLTTILTKIFEHFVFFHQGIRQLQQQRQELYQRDQDFGYKASEEPCN